MTDKEKRSKEDRSSSDSNGGGNVWMVLIAVTGVVLLSAFLFGGNTRNLRYPDLQNLLRAHAKVGASKAAPSVATENAEAVATDVDEDGADQNEAVQPKIVVTSSKNPNVLLEFSNLLNVAVGDESISGFVMYRSLGPGGEDADKADNKPQRVQFNSIRVRNEEQDKTLDQLLSQSGVIWDNARPNRFFADHWPELLMIGVLVGLGLMMLRRIGGVGSPMQFSRSRGKLHGQEDLSITFSDAAGIDEAVEEVREVVDFLKNSEKYQALGGRIPKGVLLVGPPGTGKTLLARAIAGEAGVPFFSLSGSDFVEMFVGVGAARVRDMFQQATNRAPCIIFIDELDALGKSRSGSTVGGHDEREQTLNALLVEMDGFDANSGVIVVAATNRPETLDPALLRPGRFDRQVLVDRPDVAGREDILKVHVKNVKLDESVDLKHIASITSGFVGADLANLVNEAALLAARAEKTTVEMDQFDDAVERVTAGLEKKNRVMNEDEKIVSPITKPATRWSPRHFPTPTRSTRSASFRVAWPRLATRCNVPNRNAI